MSPYDASSTVQTTSLNLFEAQAAYLTAINFVQKSKLPFLVGFSFISFDEGGVNNSASRGATVDLNACYFLTVGGFPSSKNAVIDFHFADLNSYRDLDWVNYYSDAIIFRDKERTEYKVSDLKGLSITDRTIIRIRLSFDVLLPFLGFSPYIRQKKLFKLVGANPSSNIVKYYGKVYRFDKYLDFSKNTFFKLNGDLYLCH